MRLAAILLTFALPAAGAELFSATLVPLNPEDRTDDLYPWAEAIWPGPWTPIGNNLTEDDPMEEPRAERWRLVYFPGSEESPPRLELEHLVQGDEGCCVRIEGRFLLDIGSDVRHFTFLKWTAPGSFTFTVGGTSHEAYGLEKREFRVRRASAG